MTNVMFVEEHKGYLSLSKTRHANHHRSGGFLAGFP